MAKKEKKVKLTKVEKKVAKLTKKGDKLSAKYTKKGDKKALKLTKKGEKITAKHNKKVAKKEAKIAAEESKLYCQESIFHGKLSNFIGTGILQILVIALMGGIGAIPLIVLKDSPIIGIITVAIGGLIGLCWAICIGIKWNAKHTIVAGHQLTFNGTALQLAFNIVKWLILTVLTIGIYAFWLPIKVREWKAKHTISTPVEDPNANKPQITFYTY